MQTILDKYKLQNVLFIILIAYLLLTRILLIFSYSIDLDGTEFIFVYYVQQLLEHKPIYNNPTSFPFQACLFVPIYLYVLKTIVSFFNITLQENLHFIYIVGRLFSFVLFMLQILIFTSYVKIRFKASAQIILIGTAIYLLLITGHMYVIRPDAMKYLFFSIAFILLIEYQFFNQKILYLIGFLIIGVLNVFTKQDTIVYLCMIIGCMFLATGKLKYIVLLFSFLSLVGLVFFLMVQVFGINFYTNVVLFNFQKVDHAFTSINILFVVFSSARILPLILLSLFIIKSNKDKWKNDKLTQFLFLSIISFFIISHLFMLRAGSYINYAYETIYIIIFFFAYLLMYYKAAVLSVFKWKFVIMAYIVFVFTSNILIHNYTYNFYNEKKLKTEYFECIKIKNEIKNIVKDEVVFFANIKYCLFMKDINLIYGYDYHIDRFISLYLPINLSSKLVFFDSKNYDSYFTNGVVKYIVIETNKVGYMKKNHPNYILQDKVGNLSVYSYK